MGLFKTKAQKAQQQLQELQKQFPNTWMYQIPDRDRSTLEFLVSCDKKSGTIHTEYFYRDRIQAALEDLGYKVVNVSVSDIPQLEADTFLAYEKA